MNMLRNALCFGIGCVATFGLGGCGGERAEIPVAVSPVTSPNVSPVISANGASSCAGQVLEVEPRTVAAGDTVEVHGKFYLNGCGDVMVDGVTADPSTPTSGVPLVMTSASGTRETIVKLNAAGSLGEIDYSLTIPPRVLAGTLTLRLGDAEPVTLTVTS